MSNFWKRTITGFSMVFLMMFLMYTGAIGFAAFFFVVAILGMYEFYTLTASESVSPQKFPGIIAGSIMFLLLTWVMVVPFDSIRAIITVFSAIVILSVIVITEIFRKHPAPILNIALTYLGILYIAFPLSLLSYMATKDVNHDLFGFPSFLFGYFLFTWVYDTGAYLAGMTFGKHKFFERISPKKTWEGIAGGVIVSTGLVAALMMLVPSIQWYHWVSLMLMVVIFGTLGDLAESLFKRSLSVKDSGNILPGHGGILDRFDTVLLSAPFVFLYFIIFI